MGLAFDLVSTAMAKHANDRHTMTALRFVFAMV
jgi:hypothetical protein